MAMGDRDKAPTSHGCTSSPQLRRAGNANERDHVERGLEVQSNNQLYEKLEHAINHEPQLVQGWQHRIQHEIIERLLLQT